MLEIIINPKAIAGFIADNEMTAKFDSDCDERHLAEAILTQNNNPLRIAQMLARMTAHFQGVAKLDIVNTKVLSNGEIACSFDDGNITRSGVYMPA